MKITHVREIWLENDIKRFIEEAGKLVSPFANMSYPMQIKVIAPEYGIETLATKNLDDVKIATISFSLGFNVSAQTQDSAYFNEETG